MNTNDRAKKNNKGFLYPNSYKKKPTHPDYQGKSLGTKLLKHRIDKLNSIDGIQKITVRTSQVAYKFYEKQGFELFEIKKDYWAEGFDMYNMEYKQKRKL